MVQQAAQQAFDQQFQQVAEGSCSTARSIRAVPLDRQAFQQAFDRGFERPFEGPFARAGREGHNYFAMVAGAAGAECAQALHSLQQARARQQQNANADDEDSNSEMEVQENNPDKGAKAAGPSGLAGRLPRNRDGLMKAMSNMRGYVNVPRQEFRRLQGTKRALVNGNPRSCAQDALINAAKALGVSVTKKQVYDATLPTEGDTKMGLIVDYAVNELGIQMDKNTQLNQIKGGPEYALLQHTEGVFVVELCVSQSGMDDDYHNVVYDADYQHVMYPGIRGAIIDNEKDTPVKFIEPSDRAEVQQARDVFHSLFPFASNVRVVGAWLMRRIPSE